MKSGQGTGALCLADDRTTRSLQAAASPFSRGLLEAVCRFLQAPGPRSRAWVGSSFQTGQWVWPGPGVQGWDQVGGCVIIHGALELTFCFVHRASPILKLRLPLPLLEWPGQSPPEPCVTQGQHSSPPNAPSPPRATPGSYTAVGDTATNWSTVTPTSAYIIFSSPETPPTSLLAQTPSPQSWAWRQSPCGLYALLPWCCHPLSSLMPGSASHG